MPNTNIHAHISFAVPLHSLIVRRVDRSAAVIETPVADQIACYERGLHQRADRRPGQQVVRQPHQPEQQEQDADLSVTLLEARISRHKSGEQDQIAQRILKGQEESDDSKALKQNHQALVYTEGGGRSINERLLLPSLTIKGLASGNVGKKARNVIPNFAKAAIGVRLVKGNDPEDMLDLVESHIQNQGFHIVYEDPDMATRRKYPKIAKVDRRGSGYIASRTSMEEPNAKAIIDAVREFVGDNLILMPALGGSLPLYLFTDYLKKPAIIIPVANHDNNQHAPNENLRIANLWYGIDLMGVIMTMPD